MVYNIDFLIAAMIIQILVLWYFLGQKRADDLNNQVFLLLVILSSLDIAAEMISNFYIMSGSNTYGYGAMLSTTIFYIFQSMFPLTLLWYIQTLHENRILLGKRRLLICLPTLVLMFIVITNPFTGLMFYFDAAGVYTKGSWYMLMYYSAIGHILTALLFACKWRKSLGYQKVKVVFEIIVLAGGGVLVQCLYHPLLTTGFGLSLAILALFITINNPYASKDNLTGLCNHRYFNRKCDEMVKSKKKLHIITIYLYQLRYINKIAGLQGGDYILQLTAQKISDLCGKKVFRITGKRFLIMTGSLKEYEYYLSELRKIFDTDIELKDDAITVKMPAIISGITNAEQIGSSNLILEYAEYIETLSPENGITEIMQDDLKTMKGFLYNKKVEQFLYTAISEDLFEIYFQPVYSTSKKGFITLEALSRLRHPELGWITPDLFIQIAEKNHMIERITDLQFKRICRFLDEHRDIMDQLLNVKVNLSALDLLRNDCCRHFTDIMDEIDIPHQWIQFEITETVATEYNLNLIELAHKFTAEGIQICLDDFGSGFANFDTVMKLPFGAIKMDRSLLSDISNDERQALFYKSIVEVFHGLGYNVIAEGVETEAEMKLLGAWGVDMIQGYYFSRPLPPEELLTLLRKEKNK